MSKTISKIEQENAVQDRVYEIIVQKTISPESAAAKIAKLVNAANEVAFLNMVALNDMNVQQEPSHITEFYSAMEDLSLRIY